jgi:hypothetical protein
MNVLLEIPQPIAGLILTEWMDVVEVGRLDSAFCNRQQRPAFQNTAYLSGTAYHARLYAGEEYEKLARWSVLRQATLDSVQFTAMFQNNRDVRVKLLQTSGPSIQNVSFCWNKISTDSSSSILDVRMWCPNVTEVEFACQYWVGNKTSEWDNALVQLLAGSEKLRSLTIQSIRFTTAELAHILAACGSALVRLKLVNCLGKQEPLPEQVAIPSLEELLISRHCVPAATMHAIAQNCKSLRKLRVFEKSSGNGLEESCVEELLRGCPLLAEIDAEFYHQRRVRAELRLELIRRSNMTCLSLPFAGVDRDMALSIVAVCPKLTSVRVRGDWATDAFLAECAQHCPQLRSIHVDDSTTVTNQGVVALAHSGSLLQEVSLSGCVNVGDGALAALGHHCPSLHTINLAECDAITDAGIQALTRPGSRLKDIDVEGCTKLGDAALLSIAQHCPRLRTLHEPESLTVTDASVVALAQNCRKLKNLDVNNCLNVTMESVRALAQHSTALRRLSIPYQRQRMPAFARGHHIHFTIGGQEEDRMHKDDDDYYNPWNHDRSDFNSPDPAADDSEGAGGEPSDAEGTVGSGQRAHGWAWAIRQRWIKVVKNKGAQDKTSVYSDSSESTNGTGSDLD